MFKNNKHEQIFKKTHKENIKKINSKKTNHMGIKSNSPINLMS